MRAREGPGGTEPPTGAEPGEQYLPWALERMPRDEDVVPGAAGCRAGGRAYGRAVGRSTCRGVGISGTAARRLAERRFSAGRRRSDSERGGRGRRKRGGSIERRRHADARGRKGQGRIAEVPAHGMRGGGAPTRKECVVTGLDHLEVSRSATGWGAMTRPFASARTRSASAASRAAWLCGVSRIVSASGCYAGSHRATRRAGASTSDGGKCDDDDAMSSGSVGWVSTTTGVRPESHIVRARLPPS
jgi:hypothetical protein